MDHLAHLWPDIAALTPTATAMPLFVTAWHTASRDTQACIKIDDQPVEVQPPLAVLRLCVSRLGHVPSGCLNATFGLALKDGTQTLQWAATHGHVSVIKFLKAWGLTLCHVRANHGHALHCAALRGHLDVLQFLKDWRDPDGGCLTLAQDIRHNPSTPSQIVLELAARGGHTHVLQFFKDWRDASGDRLTIHDIRANNNSVLHSAAACRHVPALQFFKDWREPNVPEHAPLEDSRLTLQDVCANRHALVRHACTSGHSEVCKFFLAWRDADRPARPQPTTPTVCRDSDEDWYNTQFSAPEGRPTGPALTVKDVRPLALWLLQTIVAAAHVDTLQVLINWRDPVTDEPCLTLADAHVLNNYLWKWTHTLGRKGVWPPGGEPGFSVALSALSEYDKCHFRMCRSLTEWGMLGSSANTLRHPFRACGLFD